MKKLLLGLILLISSIGHAKYCDEKAWKSALAEYPNHNLTIQKIKYLNTPETGDVFRENVIHKVYAVWASSEYLDYYFVVTMNSIDCSTVDILSSSFIIKCKEQIKKAVLDIYPYKGENESIDKIKYLGNEKVNSSSDLTYSAYSVSASDQGGNYLFIVIIDPQNCSIIDTSRIVDNDH